MPYGKPTEVGRDYKVKHSAHIVAVGYDEDTKTLEVEFEGKKIYQYFNVPVQKWRGIKRSKSKGEYFWRNIRSKFGYKRVR